MQEYSMNEPEQVVPRRERRAVPLSDIDLALTAQFVIAWAGEAGEEPRLGWWKTDLVSEFGGQDLFERLLPNTWQWAVLQGAREAARLADNDIRQRDHSPDELISLFNLGFELDEQVEERLQELKRAGIPPHEALRGLSVIREDWNRDAFFEWVDGHGDADITTTPVGRRIKGDAPAGLDARIRKLVAALAPAEQTYPFPHYRSSK